MVNSDILDTNNVTPMMQPALHEEFEKSTVDYESAADTNIEPFMISKFHLSKEGMKFSWI